MNFWIPNDDIQDVFGGNKRDNRYPMQARYDWLRIYQYDAAPLHNWTTASTSGGLRSGPATPHDGD